MFDRGMAWIGNLVFTFLSPSIINKWGQTLIIDFIRLYFRLISDCLDISDLTMFALRLTAEYVVDFQIIMTDIS